ncbi:hypothetical protein, partial [Staphylococcus aureus]|uniref:hypothetical protein n=1 Tax=Staphylococcus aureus TaxID=1280 RepID=UPI001C92CC0E
FSLSMTPSTALPTNLQQLQFPTFQYTQSPLTQLTYLHLTTPKHNPIPAINQLQPPTTNKSHPKPQIPQKPTQPKTPIQPINHSTTQQQQPPKHKLHQLLLTPNPHIHNPPPNPDLHNPKTTNQPTIPPITPHPNLKPTPKQPIPHKLQPQQTPIHANNPATTQQK